MADALVTLLNSKGYQPVFLPKTGLVPPEIYAYSNGRLLRYGPLSDFLTDPRHLPESHEQVPDIVHASTSRKSQSGSLSFLRDALQCIGLGSIPKVDLSFAGKGRLVFKFINVTSRSVDPSKIFSVLKYLSVRPPIDPAYAGGGQIHVVYEYLYAKELVMVRADEAQFEHDISGDLNQYIDLGVKGAAEVRGSTAISFKRVDAEPVAFAYKAGYLRKESSGWIFYPEETAMSGGPEMKRPFVPSRGIVLSVGSAGDQEDAGRPR